MKLRCIRNYRCTKVLGYLDEVDLRRGATPEAIPLSEGVEFYPVNDNQERALIENLSCVAAEPDVDEDEVDAGKVDMSDENEDDEEDNLVDSNLAFTDEDEE